MNYNYEEAVAYVLRIPAFAKKNTPEDTRRFFEYLGCPGEGARIIHVAGTNGKGSVCSYLNAVLIRAGFHTALFTSPHLMDIRERFRLDGEMMGREEFAALVNLCLDRLADFGRSGGREGYHPTFFEMIFFIGMLWFGQKHADFIVLETGMGGRLDATNVIRRPEAVIITRIGLDHMQYLGETKEQIAGEKAGIIKQGVPVVFWEQEPEVCRVIVEKANEMCAPAVGVSEKEVLFLKIGNKNIDFSVRSEYYGYIRVRLHTAAVYQKENASLAVRALEVLARSGYGDVLSKETVEQGLTEAVWAGRMDEVLPGVVIDGAHNEDGVEAFLESVRQDGCGGKRFLLFSAVSDKRVKQMVHRISDSGLFDRVAVAGLANSRSLTGEELYGLWKGQAVLYESPEEAFGILTEEKGPKDRVYAAGSLYLAGELLAWLEKRGQ